MNTWRILTVFFGLLITAPVVILNANGYNIAFWVKKEPTTPVVAPVETIIPPRDRPEVQAMFATDQLTDARYVEITEIIPHEDLLAAQEPMPDEKLLPLYATARAPARLIRYCDEVVKTIGLACDLIHSHARDNRDGKLELTGQLSFVPSFDIGNPFDMADGALIESSIVLPHQGALLPANAPNTRIAAMEQATQICAALRADYGNCVVSAMMFEVTELWITDLEALPTGTNPQRLSIQAQFTIFADPTELNTTDLQARLAQLISPA